MIHFIITLAFTLIIPFPDILSFVMQLDEGVCTQLLLSPF